VRRSTGLLEFAIFSRHSPCRGLKAIPAIVAHASAISVIPWAVEARSEDVA
jgi:hypothetical protein